MIRLLFQPFRFVYWLKMAILVLLINGLSNTNLFQYRNQQQTNFQELETMADRALEMLPFIVGIVILVILFIIVISFLSSAARVLFYRGVLDGVVYYGRFFREEGSTILSYFLWNVIVTILAFFFILLIGILFMFSSFLLGTFEGNTTGLIVSVTVGIVLFVIVIIGVIAYHILLHCMVLPQMIVEKKGIFSSWSRAIGLALEQLGEFIGFVLIRIAIGICVLLLMIVVSIFIGMIAVLFALPLTGGGELGFATGVVLTILLFPIAFALNFILLPIPTFQDTYALSFMAGITGNNNYEPGGHSPEPVDEPTFGAPIEPEEDKPSSFYSSTDSSQEQTGPIHFKDIPVYEPKMQNFYHIEEKISNESSSDEENPRDKKSGDPPFFFLMNMEGGNSKY